MQKAIKRYFPVFVLPTMIAFTIGFIAPFLLGIYLSFCKFTTVTDARFIGLENYGKVFQDPTFLHSLWYTVLFTVLSMLLINVLAFAVAMVLTKPVRGKNIFRTVFFMPEFDRWNYSGIYLAASVKRSACTLGKNTYIFRDLRVDGNDHSGVLATDWIYDDHLHFRHSEYSRRADRSGED